MFFKKVQHDAEQVAASSQELTASAEQSVLAINQVASTITEVAQGAVIQVREVDATSARVEQMSVAAEQSQHAAKEIATLINEIQIDTQSAVTVMNHGTNEVKLGTEVVNRAGQAFECDSQPGVIKACRRTTWNGKDF